MKPACSDCTNCVKIKLRSGWMEKSSRVGQGNALSEFLHNVVADDIATRRENKRPAIKTLKFADDVLMC
jgi:hypothetical protein